MTTTFEVLAAMLAADLAQARRLAKLHALDGDRRCLSCHSEGASSGRTLGCTVGWAARRALGTAAARAAAAAPVIQMKEVVR